MELNQKYTADPPRRLPELRVPVLQSQVWAGNLERGQSISEEERGGGQDQHRNLKRCHQRCAGKYL